MCDQLSPSNHTFGSRCSACCVSSTASGNNVGDLLPFLALPVRLAKTRTPRAPNGATEPHDHARVQQRSLSDVHIRGYIALVALMGLLPSADDPVDGLGTPSCSHRAYFADRISTRPSPRGFIPRCEPDTRMYDWLSSGPAIMLGPEAR